MERSITKGLIVFAISFVVLLMPLNSISSAHMNDSNTVNSAFDVNTPLHLSPFSSYTPSWKSYLSENVNISGAANESNTILNVVIGLEPSNLSELNYLLEELNSPVSGMYHHYLTQKEFIANFSPPAQVYEYLVKYYQGIGINVVTTFSDRLTLSLSGSPSEIDRAFNTSIVSYHSGGLSFYGPSSTPYIPGAVSKYISQINGLSDFSKYLIGTDSGFVKSSGGQASAGSYNGFPLPAVYNGVQLIYGSDLQIAYQEQQLFNQYGYPTSQSEATILWSGYYNGSNPISTPDGLLNPGTPVGPYVPSDIYSYYNETLPSGEPHSTVVPEAYNGAPQPGLLASYDTTGANLENTLDLEMLGTTAPGSTIYNVYGGSPSFSNLDGAFSYILSNLPTVKVISNSWGASDHNDSTWYNDLKEAQTRGISVLVASGDSGDNPSSSKYVGTQLWYPATMAYDNFGDIAVGGTNLTLTPTLNMENQTNWYMPPSETYGPLGTTSGISTVFSEPSWQVSSSANSLISGQGRGVPDISAIGNNTLITYTQDSYTYQSTNASNGHGFVYVFGTSVACPVVAGIISTVDYALLGEGGSLLGFADPAFYSLGTQEYSHNPPQGVQPFSPVIYGMNAVYTDRYGYTLVNGWGSLNAYNFTTFFLKTFTVTFTEKGLSNDTQWTVVISGISYHSKTTTIEVNLTNGTYTFSASASSYTEASNSSSFTVNGANLSVNLITFTPQSPTSPIVVLIVVGIILLVVIIILAMVFSGRKKT